MLGIYHDPERNKSSADALHRMAYRVHIRLFAFLSMTIERNEQGFLAYK